MTTKTLKIEEIENHDELLQRIVDTYVEKCLSYASDVFVKYENYFEPKIINLGILSGAASLHLSVIKRLVNDDQIVPIIEQFIDSVKKQQYTVRGGKNA